MGEERPIRLMGGYLVYFRSNLEKEARLTKWNSRWPETEFWGKWLKRKKLLTFAGGGYGTVVPLQVSGGEGGEGVQGQAVRAGQPLLKVEQVLGFVVLWHVWGHVQIRHILWKRSTQTLQRCCQHPGPAVWNLRCVPTISRSKRMNSRPDTNVRKRAKWSSLQTSAFLLGIKKVLSQTTVSESTCEIDLKRNRTWMEMQEEKVKQPTWSNTCEAKLDSPERGAGNSPESSHSKLGITRHDLNRKQLFKCTLQHNRTCDHQWHVWDGQFTSAKVGRYVLKVIHLPDSLSSGEVKNQDPVPRRDVLQPVKVHGV